MYKSIIRPVLFIFKPESIHHLVFKCLKTSDSIGLGNVVNSLLNPGGLQMETVFCGIKFSNRVGIAAGFDKNAEVYEILGKFGFGHIEIGTVTPRPQFGNAKPRLFRLKADKALINRMGFNNLGLEKAIKKLKKSNKKLIIGGNIGKNTNTPNDEAIIDYLACFEGLYPYVDYITVNVSCPNISDLKKLQDQEELEKILGSIMTKRSEMSVYKPVLLKISPDLNFRQIDETLEVIKRCKIDGIVATNTTVTREKLKTPSHIVNSIGNGGLSGQPLKSKSTEIIRYINEKTNGQLPIIGVGGIETPQDALDKINAGATLVQVYTGFIYSGPTIAKQINKYLKCKLHM
jgi:dihydroorotate dehydrogenase